MVYNEQTVSRLRNALAGVEGVTEQRMMGGMCFMLDGNMIGGADNTKQGVRRFMFRIGKDNQAKGAAMPGAQPMEMGGRRMGGFFFVEEEGCDDALLKRWLDLALDFVTTLPPK